MWKSINYEVRGRGHIKTDTPCQDKTISCQMDGVEMIALADGAGSAKYSHWGAEIVIASVCEFVSKNFTELVNNPDGKQLKIDILEYLLLKLREKSVEIPCELKDLASTLLMVAVSGSTFIILHIGDGVVGYLKKNELKVASMPENGEFVNTTTFVTSKDAITSMKLLKGSAEDISGFVLISDGAAESFYHKRSKSLSSVIIKMMHRTTMLVYDKIFSMIKDSFDQIVVLNTQDDCSIAVLSRSMGVLCDYFDMTEQQKCEILGIKPYKSDTKRRIKRFDLILQNLKNIKTIKNVSRILHLKKKYTKKYLNKLENVGLIICEGTTSYKKTL